MENTKEIKKEKNYKKYKPLFIGTLVICILSIVVNIYLSISSFEYEYSYTIKYVSTIKTDTTTDFVCEINKITYDNYLQLNSADFSIMINNVATSSYGITFGAYTTSNLENRDFNSYEKIESGNLVIRFKYSIEDIDAPIKLMYKGKKLKLGEKIKFYE